MEKSKTVLVSHSELNQIANPYYSTIAFDKFLNKHGCYQSCSSVLDLGTGIAANLHYFRSQHPEIKFVGSDYHQSLIEKGRELLKENNVQGVDLYYADIMDLPNEWINKFDGIISIHTFCCFKDIVDPLASICKLKPKWIAINSLFYDGPLDALIHIRAHNTPEISDDNPDGDFNIFSLENCSKIFLQHGYDLINEPFFPEVKLKKPDDNRRGTYTMKTELHENTQFSGPVHLPWCFLLARLNT